MKKRFFKFVLGGLLAAVSFAAAAGPFSGPSPSCTLPSNITVNGAALDPFCTIQFLNNPTFPGGIGTAGSPVLINGGIAAQGSNALAPLRVANIPLGPVALASIGTNTTDVAGQFWLTDVYVPVNKTVTKIGFLQGGTATTDNCLVALYNPNGTLLTTSALAGVVLSGANTFQEQTLLAAQAIQGPGIYYVGVQCNGTAAGAIQTVASPYTTIRTGTLSGTFGTVPASITTPTAFTTGQAPVVYLF